VLVRDHRALDEHLTELGVTGHLTQRPDLHSVRVHVEDEHGDAIALTDVRIRPARGQAPAREVAVACPYLLPGHGPEVPVRHRPRRQARQVRSGTGLAEQLAPDLALLADSREKALFLKISPPFEERGSGVKRGVAQRPRHLVAIENLPDPAGLLGRGVMAPVLTGPGRNEVSGLAEPPPPVLRVQRAPRRSQHRRVIGVDGPYPVGRQLRPQPVLDDCCEVRGLPRIKRHSAAFLRPDPPDPGSRDRDRRRAGLPGSGASPRRRPCVPGC
jgi:hypothetical protein